jgi:hypothetical protein
MVFDARGDLLVDRFEMGCNWTRGGLNPSINSSYDTQPSSVINPGAAGLDKFTGLTMTFLPLSSAGNNFKGCTGRLDDNNWSYQPGISDSSFPAYAPNDSVVPLDQDADGTVSWKRIRPGDCVGSYGNTIAFSACADDSKAYKYPFHFPGMKDDGNNCTTGQTMDNINWDLYHTQSEYAAVFYNRLKSSNYAFNSYQGAGGNPLILDYDSAGSSCYINLPYANAASQWRARWIPVSSLGQAGLGHAGSGPGVQFPSLWTKTIDEIQTGAAFAGNLNYNPFYDPGNNINPITFPATTRFAKNTTPIARIITSNNAKLPPIAHLSQEDMHDVCTSYKVEVGTYNDTSSNFVALEPVKNKRLPRKKETILYSAWPEHYDATKIVNIQRGTFTAPPVDDTFGGTDNQSCKTGNKTTPFNGQWQAFANYFLTPGYPNNSSENNVVLMTGTSPLDNGSQNNITRAYDTNTQKCVSRWGVQDVVGNLSEMTTDQVFCNFSTEELWVSPAGNAGDQAKGIIASGLYGALYRGGISANPLAYWVVHLPGTGQCSSIENGPGRAWPVANPPLIYSIFDPATPSGYNTSFIKTFNSADQESIEDMRNGDGYFLDFGEVNIASPISEDNMLGIQNPVGNLMRAKYFNPVVGIPLECGAGTCAATEDNTLFGTDTWVSAAYLTGTEGHVLPGFPVHNDYAYSDGIGILSAPALRFDFPTTSLGLPATINYLDTVDTGGVAPYYTIAAADPLVTPVKLYYQYWKVYRNRPLIFYIGGSTADGSVGRYTYHFRGYSIAEMRNNWSTGFRCIVRVSEGD